KARRRCQAKRIARDGRRQVASQPGGASRLASCTARAISRNRQTLSRSPPAADVGGVSGIELVIGTLRQVAADPRTRGPLVGVLRGDGELDLHVPPHAAPQSPASFFCAIRGIVQEATPSAIGLVLPVRSLWGDAHVCDYLDAEAFA